MARIGPPTPTPDEARARNVLSIATRRVNTARRRLTLAQLDLEALPDDAPAQARRGAQAHAREASEDYAQACEAREALRLAKGPQAPHTASTAPASLDDWN